MVWRRVHRGAAGILGAAGLYFGYCVCLGPKEEMPQLHYCGTDRNSAIVDQCPALRNPYRPIPWLTNRHLQSMVYVVATSMSKVDWKKTDFITTPDGGTIKLLWESLPDKDDGSPTVLLMHGLTGCSRNMGPHIPKLKAAGFRVVGLDRRGHSQPLTTSKFSTFGEGEDVIQAVEEIHRQVPLSKIAIVSLCAGGGTMLHYALLEHEKLKAAVQSGDYKPSPVKACVALSPAPDLPECLRTLSESFMYNNYFVRRLKKIYLEPNQSLLVGSPAYDACQASTSFIGFVRAHLPYTGYESFERYMENFDFWRYMEACTALKMDSLVVSAFNDPVCVRSTMAAYVEKVHTSPYLMFVLTKTGSHVGWYEWRKWSEGLTLWADDVTVQWLSAVLKPSPPLPV